MNAKLLQSCPTLCDTMGCSLPGSSVLGTIWARILEWVAMCSSRGSPNPGIEPTSLMSFALAGRFFTTRAPRKPYIGFTYSLTFCCSITCQRPSLIFEFSENLSNFLRRLWYSSFYSKVISLALVCEEKN